jgi:hypothetical protein
MRSVPIRSSILAIIMQWSFFPVIHLQIQNPPRRLHYPESFEPCAIGEAENQTNDNGAQTKHAKYSI